MLIMGSGEGSRWSKMIAGKKSPPSHACCSSAHPLHFHVKPWTPFLSPLRALLAGAPGDDSCKIKPWASNPWLLISKASLIYSRFCLHLNVRGLNKLTCGCCFLHGAVGAVSRSRGSVGRCLVYPLTQSFTSHVVFDPQFVSNAFIRHWLYEKQVWRRPQISSASPTRGSLVARSIHPVRLHQGCTALGLREALWRLLPLNLTFIFKPNHGMNLDQSHQFGLKPKCALKVA